MTWHDDIPLEYRNQIVTGDARVLAERLPDASVDLIFTDPVYDRIGDYAWLAETAARVLRPGGAICAFAGIGYLGKTAIALDYGDVRYRWTVPIYQPTISRRADVFFGLWYPLVIAFNGKARTHFTPRDLHVSRRTQALPANHTFHWTKDPDVISYYIEAFTQSGAVTLDPFTGGGTVPAVCKMLNRNYIAFEIDADTAARARVRVEQTQAMHPVLLGVQEPMELAV